MFRSERFVAAVLLAGAILSSGCSKDKGTTIVSPPRPPAHVMVVHASPEGPTVDLYLDGATTALDLAYGSHTPYLEVPAGTHSITVKSAGTATTLLSITGVPVASGVSYTVFAADTASALGTGPKVAPAFTIDDLTPPAAGTVCVRLAPFVPDAPAAGLELAVQSPAQVLFTGKLFVQTTAFASLPAGTYDLDVRRADTHAVLTTAHVVLADGKLYTLVAEGYRAGVGAQAVGTSLIVNN